jgi:hypothetical protein
MEEKILYLPLKKKWYEMIESGEKPEEYVQRGFCILKNQRLSQNTTEARPVEAARSVTSTFQMRLGIIANIRTF